MGYSEDQIESGGMATICTASKPMHAPMDPGTSTYEQQLQNLLRTDYVKLSSQFHTPSDFTVDLCEAIRSMDLVILPVNQIVAVRSVKSLRPNGIQLFP
ncbi:Protein of unknown function [Pyronema omphalodes CBS 100304]|uniref:Uncharacterized protein n=1 Tax=Pyronema omphalodes (strain CBS 100304) TaxID=1076935 RepID=U4LA27_PYROM|nr:Protein of unknown function [Pyronema omphalodes CBS 100304]